MITLNAQPIIQVNELFFSDNGQIRSVSNNHRIRFRKSEDILELQEYGAISFSSGVTDGSSTNKMWLESNGNLGIGTTTPDSKLHVYNDVDGASNLIANFESLRSNSNVYLRLKNLDYTGGNDYMLFAAADGAVGFHQSGKGNRFVLGQSGNVGIGSYSSSRKLRVYSNENGIALFDNPFGAFQVFGTKISFVSTITNGNPHCYLQDQDNSDDRYLIQGLGGGGNVDAFYVTSSGKTGLGVVPSGDYRLEVNGTIRAKEIIVASDWADFVFDEDYKLPSLSEVEAHIAEFGHLPGIPSEEDVESQGVSLGEMNARLLQKVEELTLYTLEQQKEIEELRALILSKENNHESNNL